MFTTHLTGKSRLSLLLCLAGVLSFVAPKAYADDGDQADPPSRVARISYTDGSVSLQPGGSGDWAEAAKNRPVTIGDKIWADKDARAELQAGQASIHLGSMTALSFLNLDQAVVQMRLPEGSINFRVRELREGDLYEVDTPNAAFTVKEAGAFRIDVSESGDGTRVTVIRGEGEVTSAGKTYPVHAGERAEFNGTDNNVQYSINQAPGPDGLDRWAGERDTKEENSVSAKYVSRETVGYSDLDDNGTWSEEPNYGPVWYPNTVAVGWAPYSYGSWNWVGPWGWTWVDYSPWGFAPFHYGRWNYFGGRWGWCPGPIGAYPIYGPAFVGFLGGGFGFGFSAGWGVGVGWFPLGWGEPFHPWFHCSNRFVTNINIHNTTIHNVNVINNTHNFNYAYAHNVNAVTATSRNTFVNGQAVNRGAAHLTEASLRNAQVNNRGAGFSPTKQSFTGAAHAGAHVSAPPSSIQNRSVMARTAPASAASHMPVRTMNTSNLSAGRVGNSPVSGGFNRANSGSFSERGSAANNSGMTARQQQLSQNRPPSAMSNNGRTFGNTPNNNVSQQRTANGSRTWEAQGNATDRGRAPSGFGSERSTNQPNQMASAGRTDRPPWAGSGRASVNGGASNSPSNGGMNSNRPAYSNGGNRSYEPPQRTTPNYSNRGGYTSQPRSYTPPSRSYSAPSAPSRTYSAPSRSYPAPSRSYSAPSHSYSAPSRSYSGGGGGGSYHGGGGGSSHGGGGGGGSHGGGAVSHGHR
jgi:hypothetical protein